LLKKNVKVSLLNSSISKAEKERVRLDLIAKKPETKLLYVTPELIDTENFTKELQSLDKRGLLALFAIDEAHCISSWGHDFRPKFRKLSMLKQQFPHVPVMALTATATAKVQEDVQKILGLVSPHKSLMSFNRINIKYEVRYKALLENSYKDLKEFILNQPDPKKCCGVIYCQKRETCEEIASLLVQDGILASAYHAGLADSKRDTILKDWTRDKLYVIVATIAFGMGIDKPDVRFVIHYQLPKSLEAFYQESGRAGRDGKSSTSLLYYSRDDKNLIEFLMTKSAENTKKEKAPQQVEQMNGFTKVVDYCTTASCRRKKLLVHFGENLQGSNCKNCDYCLNPDKMKETIKTLTSLGFQSFKPMTSNTKLPGFTTAGNKPWMGMGKINPSSKKSDILEDEDLDEAEDEEHQGSDVQWISESIPVAKCPSMASGADEDDVWSALEKAEEMEEKKKSNKTTRGWTTAKDLFSQKRQKNWH